MITRDEVMQFFREDEESDNIHSLSTDDKLELLISIASRVNDDLEYEIDKAIRHWGDSETD